jgi:hypothetical protein
LDRALLTIYRRTGSISPSIRDGLKAQNCQK